MCRSKWGELIIISWEQKNNTSFLNCTLRTLSLSLFQRRRANILLEPTDTFFSGYNSQVNPEITNAFATAALRVGHTLIKDNLGQFGRQFRQRGSISTKTFFDPSPLYAKSGNGMTGILLGLVTQTSQKVDR